jgi:hypothetical protein
MLGLFMMWLAYHSLSKESAAEHMVAYFSANLRAVAALALQPGSEPPKMAMKRIRALRTQIENNFQNVMAQSDAVALEFGMQRAEAMANRALIKSWQPQLQTIYLEQVALMQHRVFGAEEHLPAAVQTAQRRFNEACAALLMQMADQIDGQLPAHWADLDAPLSDLSHVVDENSSQHAGLVAAQGLERLSMQIRDLLMEMSQEIIKFRPMDVSP